MNRKKIAILLTFCIGLMVTLTSCGAPYSGVKMSDYVRVGKYKGLEVEKVKSKVTDKMVNAHIDKILQSKATTKQVKRGTVKKGSNIIISYVGKIDGKKFDKGSAEGQNLTVGSKQYIKGFEEGLIGAKVGDKKVLKLKFPKKYADSKVAGKDVVFEVKIDSIQQVTTPKLDKDFVKKNSEFKTVAEYKKSIKEGLEKQNKENGISVQRSYLWNKVVSNCAVKKDKDGNEKYPEKEVTRVADTLTDQYKSLAKQNHLEFKDFIKKQLGMDEKAFEKQLNSYAKTVVKEDMIAYYIADKEGIKVTDEDYKDYVEKNLKKFGYTEKSFKEATGKTYEEAYGGKDNIKTQVYKDKVLSFILKEAKEIKKIKH